MVSFLLVMETFGLGRGKTRIFRSAIEGRLVLLTNNILITPCFERTLVYSIRRLFLESLGSGDGESTVVFFDDAEDSLVGFKSFQFDGRFFGESKGLIGAIER